jgi:hypothetical protein
MGVITALAPLKEPRRLPVREELQMDSSRVVFLWGALLICAVLGYYVVFP